MATEMLTRRRVLQTAALAASGLAAPFVRAAGAAASPGPQGGMVLAWHTNIAPRWLDPQQHDDGGATPDNFLNVLHDALIKNFRTELYEHPALAARFRRRPTSRNRRQQWQPVISIWSSMERTITSRSPTVPISASRQLAN